MGDIKVVNSDIKVVKRDIKVVNQYALHARDVQLHDRGALACEGLKILSTRRTATLSGGYHYQMRKASMSCDRVSGRRCQEIKKGRGLGRQAAAQA